MNNLEEKIPNTRKEAEVWKACDILWNENKTVSELTLDAIADQLLNMHCKRGSNSDISRFKKTWLHKNDLLGAPAYTQKTPSHPTITPSPLSNMDKAYVKWREEVEAQAQSKIETLQAAHHEEVETLKEETTILQEAHHALKEQQQTIETNYQSLQHDYQQAKATITQQTQIIQSLEHQLAEEKKSAKLAQSQVEQRLQDLQTSHQDIVKRFEQHIEDFKKEWHVQSQDYKEVITQQRQNFLVQVQDLQSQVTYLTKDLARSETNEKIQQTNINALEEEKQILQHMLQEKQTVQTQERSKNESLIHQNKWLQEKLSYSETIQENQTHVVEIIDNHYANILNQIKMMQNTLRVVMEGQSKNAAQETSSL